MKRKERKLFSALEDQKLIGLYAIHGNCWKQIALRMPGRNAKQCKERFELFLNPSINFSSWNDEEDKLLIMAVDKNGRKWTKLTSLFNRTPHQLKNRYNYLLRHNNINKQISLPDWRNEKIIKNKSNKEDSKNMINEFGEDLFSDECFDINFENDTELCWECYV